MLHNVEYIGYCSVDVCSYAGMLPRRKLPDHVKEDIEVLIAKLVVKFLEIDRHTISFILHIGLSS